MIKTFKSQIRLESFYTEEQETCGKGDAFPQNQAQYTIEQE